MEKTDEERIEDIKDKIKNHNLDYIDNPEQKGDWYYCTNHKKVHPYTLQQHISFVGYLSMWGFDSLGEIEKFVDELVAIRR